MFVVSYLYVGLVNVNEIWTGDVSTIVVLQMKVEAKLIGTFTQYCNNQYFTFFTFTPCRCKLQT